MHLTYTSPTPHPALTPPLACKPARTPDLVCPTLTLTLPLTLPLLVPPSHWRGVLQRLLGHPLLLPPAMLGVGVGASLGASLL